VAIPASNATPITDVMITAMRAAHTFFAFIITAFL
jgi:hypothetical protein